MKKKIFATIFVAVLLATAFAGCKTEKNWNDGSFDLSLPDLQGIGTSADSANTAGWYSTLIDDFDGRETLNKEGENIWTTSPHAVRWETNTPGKPIQTSYWCPSTVSIKNGNVEVVSYQTSEHICRDENGNELTGDARICPKEGRFTGGIETRKVIASDQSNNTGKADELLFSQAYGYFETRVKFPNADGLWSAFWLQSSNMRNTLNDGLDGTEIDVYESAFRKTSKNGKKSTMGHALLWNGYTGGIGKVDDYILELKQDLYDGYHTFGLKWTPEYYVFYIDGVATWATRGGGVARVKEFLRLTVEMDAGDGLGPHGQTIGQFDPSTKPIFYVDYVKVYQNTNFEQYIIDDKQFPSQRD